MNRKNLEVVVYKKLFESAWEISRRIPAIITGGCAANHYFPPKYRRISNDVDMLIPSNARLDTLLDFTLSRGYDPVLNQCFYSIAIKRLYVFLIPAPITYFNLLKMTSITTKLQTFLEYLNEDINFEFVILDPLSIAYFKVHYLINPKRRGETIKDIYDIPLLRQDLSKLPEDLKPKVLASLKAAYYLIDRYIQKIKNHIISGEFPEDWKIIVGSLQGPIDKVQFLYISLIVGLEGKDIKKIIKYLNKHPKKAVSGYIAYELYPILHEIDEEYIDLIKERGNEGFEKLLDYLIKRYS